MKRATLRQLRRELEGYTLHKQIRVMARAGKGKHIARESGCPMRSYSLWGTFLLIFSLERSM